jgi:hypothetical protein
VNGFKEVGFVYLEGHGIPPNTIDNVFKKVWALVKRDRRLTEIAFETECGILPVAIIRQSRDPAGRLMIVNQYIAVG